MGWSRRDVLAMGLTAGLGLASDVLRGPSDVPSAVDAAGGVIAPAPPIVACPAWHARPPRSPVRIWDRRPIRILVHHTASANQADVSRAAADRLARSIQNLHMDRNGWIDSGQHFTVSRGGVVLEGRSLSLGELNGGRRQVEGAHCTGQNVVAIGIENEGTYIDQLPPPALWASLRALCAYVCRQYGIAPSELYGHRDYKNTICPGDRLYGQLPRLRSEVAAVLGRKLSATEARKASWPLLRPGDTGPLVTAAQFLLRDAGSSKRAPSGRFDAATADAVREFQAVTGAEEINGLLGGESWPALARTVRSGPGYVQGDARRAVQVLASYRAVESVPDTVDAPVWQRLLGTEGAPVPPAVDPPGTLRR